MTDGLLAADGLLLPPGAGEQVQPTMTMKLGADRSDAWSAFEATVPPGFDVGAHWHGHADETFYVVEGELDLLASFHPRARAIGDWLTWEAEDGTTVYRGGPGSFMYVPAGCPHAFYNPGTTTAKTLFMVTPSGHEKYLAELSELLLSGEATPDLIAELRLKHDIHQLTPLQNRPSD
ncbi:cupin domain-containing protein [Nocardia seriolae]|uniref:Cupin n=1 Tax=Nocardia seriolae TaxID=37332 RepID=A0ABC9YNT0_9NOCA|nr:cupin domain-containing protein [Nocardia seriolae]WKY50708.1 cupin domain-containing protein [Nocardia seriolae]BAW05412.1 cupin [Nocardia seriolae]BEK89941.1 cupin domain-containing protein [Nocardia seriolae]BEK94224.1 cupin domain-containing protein [Nocardia seriolae]GAM44978.1 cupin [Nocardia seriolae]